MLSFSASAKAEICKIFPQDKETALAECFGILLFANSFHVDGIRIVTESLEFSVMLPKLFRKAFGIDFDTEPHDGTGSKQVFQIVKQDKIAKILSSYGFDALETMALHLNLPVVEEDIWRTAFLRGAFLAGGSVTDPAKGYHMELSTTHISVARECLPLIADALGFFPKNASRGGGQVLYIKQSNQISDFLTYLGAPIASMGIIETRIEKELNNKVNRRCNCDDANISKVIDAAQEQLAAIRVLRERGIFEELPAKIKLAAIAREDNPELSLTELAEIMEPPITKPAMSHRLKRLVQFSEEAVK